MSDLDNMMASKSGGGSAGSDSSDACGSGAAGGGGAGSGTATGSGSGANPGSAAVGVDLSSIEFQSSPPTGMSPDAIAASDELNMVAVLNGSASTIRFYKVDPARPDVVKPGDILGGPGSGDLQFQCAGPQAGGTVYSKLAFAKAGDVASESVGTPMTHLLVADTGNNRVMEVDAVSRTLVGYLISPTSPFKCPTGIAASPKYIAVTTQITQLVPGNCRNCGYSVPLARAFENQILLFSATYRPGTTQRSLLWCVDGGASGTPRGLSLPLCVRLTADGRSVAVGDHGNGRIVVLSAVDGSFVKEVPMRTPGVQPCDIEECAAGWLVVTGGSAVMMVPHDDAADVVSVGTSGSSALEFSGAKALALTPRLGLAVVEAANNRFQVLK